jgi:hypothetical protein
VASRAGAVDRWRLMSRSATRRFLVRKVSNRRFSHFSVLYTKIDRDRSPCERPRGAVSAYRDRHHAENCMHHRNTRTHPHRPAWPGGPRAARAHAVRRVRIREHFDGQAGGHARGRGESGARRQRARLHFEDAGAYMSMARLGNILRLPVRMWYGPRLGSCGTGYEVKSAPVDEFTVRRTPMLAY